jgi:hypothetical protein
VSDNYCDRNRNTHCTPVIRRGREVHLIHGSCSTIYPAPRSRGKRRRLRRWVKADLRRARNRHCRVHPHWSWMPTFFCTSCTDLAIKPSWNRPSFWVTAEMHVNRRIRL